MNISKIVVIAMSVLLGACSTFDKGGKNGILPRDKIIEDAFHKAEKELQITAYKGKWQLINSTNTNIIHRIYTQNLTKNTPQFGAEIIVTYNPHTKTAAATEKSQGTLQEDTNIKTVKFSQEIELKDYTKAGAKVYEYTVDNIVRDSHYVTEYKGTTNTDLIVLVGYVDDTQINLNLVLPEGITIPDKDVTLTKEGEWTVEKIGQYGYTFTPVN